MGWQAHLQLRAARDGPRTVVRDRHVGPLRVLAALHPEGPTICHQVLVHPPGGLVGGDTVDLDVDVATDAHLLLTTPGATRLYRSAGGRARQQVTARLAAGARLEWLPLETLVYPGARSECQLSFDLDAGSRMIGFDVLALGLPASGQAFDRGDHLQHLEIPGLWRERARVDAADARLLRSPLGWGGRPVLATAWAAAGEPWDPATREALVEGAREAAARSALHGACGVTAPDARLVVVRVLADRVEPAFELLKACWQAWRPVALGVPAADPRIWRT
jgi:urease accessory protein